jgi:hypothetical protein
MSRVFDVPRYTHQTMNMVLLHHDLYIKDRYGADKMAATLRRLTVRLRFGDASARGKTLDSVRHDLAMYESLEGDDMMKRVDHDLDDNEMYIRYSLLFTTQHPGSEMFLRVSRSGGVIDKIFTCTRGKKVWTDSAACLRLTEAYISRRYVGKIPASVSAKMGHATRLAKDLCTVGLVACRFGENVREKILFETRAVEDGSDIWRAMAAWCLGFEGLRMRSFSAEIREAHDRLRDGESDMGAAAFEVENANIIEMLGCVSVHRILGLYFLEYEDAVYILDYSSLDQMHGVSKTWEGFYGYAENYRLCGGTATPRPAFIRAVDICRDWIACALRHSMFSESLARSMKQSLALLQNEFHASEEKLNVHYEAKTKEMEALIRDIIPLPVYWHEIIARLDVADRARLDIANMYYALPCPDCNLQALFARASDYMQHGNQANAEFFKRFMNYCKAMDLCKCLCKFGKAVTFSTIDGYDPTETKWFKSCLKGKNVLPPYGEMGKAWVSEFFPFNDSVSTWFWEAADVTRVPPDMSLYEEISSYRAAAREEHNELLYALKYAPNLTPNLSPTDVWVGLLNDTDNWDRVAGMSAKAENTKPAAKVREIWSGDAITRELTSCYDRAAIPFASLFLGVTARKSDSAVQAIFDRLCTLTRPDCSKKMICISNDVSGWSPQADREKWCEHHDYLIGMTKAPRKFKLQKIWRGIHAVLSKRGYLNTIKLERGLFQGWTGCADSILNVHLSLFSTNESKRKGALLSSEAANTAGLIDDAVQAVELQGDLDHMQAAADTHFLTTTETWNAAGAKIDTVKTIYSTIKFIYLNRFFCQGSEVLTPMKIYARADKEYSRRFATVFAQMDTVLGAYRSAVEKGACPLACYFAAMRRCVELAVLTNRQVAGSKTLQIINAAFAPRGFGGWGLPHLTAWLTQESRDVLCRYTATIASFADAATDAPMSMAISSLLTQTLAQSPRRIRAMSVLADPLNVAVEAAPDPAGSIMSRIRAGMVKRCESEVFRSALLQSRSQEADDAVRKMFSAIVVDVAVLELLGQCLPEACSAALVDRAYRNELILNLFSFRVRGSLLKQVRGGGRAAIGHLLSLHEDVPTILHTRVEAYELARATRENFLAHNGFVVVNHTVPDYGTHFVRLPDAAFCSTRVTYNGIKAGCPHEGADYANLYDGMLENALFRTPRGRSVYTFTGERYRNMTPAQRCINKAAVVSAYISKNSEDGQLYWDFVMSMWGAPTRVIPPAVQMEIPPGASAKRLSASTSHSSHPIAAFRNTQGMVTVEAANLGRYLESQSVHVDFLSVITAQRVTGLIEYACHPDAKRFLGESLNYGNLRDSLPMSDKRLFVVIDDDTVDDALQQMRGVVDRALFASVFAAMTEVSFARDEDDQFVAISYSAEHRDVTRIGNLINVAPGHIATLLHIGVVTTSVRRKATMSMVIEGDEARAISQRTADSRYRKLRDKVPPSQAILVVMMETLRDLCAGPLKMRVAIEPWPRVAETFLLEFPELRNYWFNLRSLAKKYVKGIDHAAARALLPKSPDHVLRCLENLSESEDNVAAEILSRLYLAAHGRLQGKDSYTLTSVLGPEHVGRCWDVAARIRRARRGAGVKHDTELGMASIYSAVAESARKYRSKPDVVSSLFNGLVMHMAKEYNITLDIDPPDCIASLNDARDSFLDLCCFIIRKSRGRMNADWMRPQIANLMEDISVIGDVRTLLVETTDVEVYQVGSSSASAVPLVIPEMPQQAVGAIADDLFAEDGEEADAGPSDEILNAVAAYADGGMTFAIKVLSGEELFVRDADPAQWLIEEFLKEYEEHQNELGSPNWQMPDEPEEL